MKSRLLTGSAMAVAALLTAGCATVHAHKGAVIDPQLVGAIQPGVDNKASVEKLLGRPSFDGGFTQNDWYYVARDTNQLAFRNPRVVKETVIHIRFDQAGNVYSIQRTGKELASNIDPSHRRTPTLGKKKSLLEDIFGGIGTVGAPGGAPGPQQ